MALTLTLYPPPSLLYAPCTIYSTFSIITSSFIINWCCCIIIQCSPQNLQVGLVFYSSLHSPRLIDFDMPTPKSMSSALKLHQNLQGLQCCMHGPSSARIQPVKEKEEIVLFPEVVTFLKCSLAKPSVGQSLNFISPKLRCLV